MENSEDKNLITFEMVEMIVKDSFGITSSIPESMTISYVDLVNYTKFAIETALRASFRETDKQLKKQHDLLTKINYN